MAYDPFEHMRTELAEAESRLTGARANMETVWKRNKKPLTGIFSETLYVPRETAEQWLDNAERKFLEKERENFAYVKEALAIIAAKKAPDTNDPDEEPGDEGDDSPHTPPDKSKKGKKKAAPADEEDDEAKKAARFFESRGGGDDDYWSRANATAAAIIAAGAKRRGEKPKRPAWETHGATKPSPHLTIVPGAPLPENPTARAIVLAGQRRRGEIK